MKDREGFLLKLCIILFLCVVGFVIVCVLPSCCSTAKVEISKEFYDESVF